MDDGMMREHRLCRYRARAYFGHQIDAPFRDKRGHIGGAQDRLNTSCARMHDRGVHKEQPNKIRIYSATVEHHNRGFG